MHGIPNVVAVGTTGKALARALGVLYSYGVKQFVFITDNDKASQRAEAALAAVDQARKRQMSSRLNCQKAKILMNGLTFKTATTCLCLRNSAGSTASVCIPTG